MHHASCGGLLRGARLLDPVRKIIATHGFSGNSLCSSTSAPILIVRRVAPIGLLVGMSRPCFPGIAGNVVMGIGFSICNSRRFRKGIDLICPAVSTTARAFPMRMGLTGAHRHVHPKVFNHIAIDFNALQRIIIPSRTVIGHTNSNSHCMCICGSNGISCGGMRLKHQVKARCRLVSKIRSGSRIIITNRAHLTSNIRITMGWGLEVD